ncbi:bifunctional precorrin-2 dehydrogenase/sirohydrochlorin ferrochelatase [Salinithrix halophila]|uniref:precorrin-2 dehydrogenase n=1 Tax=Salinithrix halophila TaxID=1485204 RepID=A0ABV8JBB8_9BACL
MIDLESQPALVVGGGKVALRRVRTLLEAGAKVTLVAPEASTELIRLAGAKQIAWRKKIFASDDLGEAWVVVAATDDPEVNRFVAEAAGPRRLVNVADQPELGNFRVPVRLQRGRLIFSVSTGGASPILARKIRDDLAEQYDQSWEEKLDRLYEERRQMKASGWSQAERKERLRRLVEELITDM